MGYFDYGSLREKARDLGDDYVKIGIVKGIEDYVEEHNLEDDITDSDREDLAENAYDSIGNLGENTNDHNWGYAWAKAYDNLKGETTPDQIAEDFSADVWDEYVKLG